MGTSIDRNEAIVLLFCTPPPAEYFGLTSYVTNRVLFNESETGQGDSSLIVHMPVAEVRKSMFIFIYSFIHFFIYFLTLPPSSPRSPTPSTTSASTPLRPPPLPPARWTRPPSSPPCPLLSSLPPALSSRRFQRLSSRQGWRRELLITTLCQGRRLGCTIGRRRLSMIIRIG